MTHYDTVDTVSKLSDLRKAPHEATQTCSGNSNLHINYVSMELCQQSGKKAEFSSEDSQIQNPQERAPETRRGKLISAGAPLLHRLMETSNIASASQVDLN